MRVFDDLFSHSLIIYLELFVLTLFSPFRLVFPKRPRGRRAEGFIVQVIRLNFGSLGSGVSNQLQDGCFCLCGEMLNCGNFVLYDSFRLRSVASGNDEVMQSSSDRAANEWT